jgi:hypothetical protein
MPETNERSGVTRRLEWISLLYLVIFVLAVMSPSIISSDFYGVPEQHVEEILIFLFGLTGLGIFSIYERVMERRLKERDEALSQSEKALKELLESYRYIGSVNRQIDVLKQLVNETSLTIVGKDSYEKDLMRSILSNAASSVNARGALVRFLELGKLRTEREYHHESLNGKVLKVANKELKNLHQFGAPYAFMRTEDGHEIIAVPSDRKDSKVKAYLILIANAADITEIEISLLKVFANQAELVYHQILGKRMNGDNGQPLQKIDEVADMAVGEVS